MSDFRDYCRGMTDEQVRNILDKEDEGRKRDPDREADYRDAREELVSRGIDPDEK